MQNSQAILVFVGKGERLPIPDDCPYKEVISACWQGEPEKRPSFDDVVNMLGKPGTTQQDMETTSGI